MLNNQQYNFLGKQKSFPNGKLFPGLNKKYLLKQHSAPQSKTTLHKKRERAKHSLHESFLTPDVELCVMAGYYGEIDYKMRYKNITGTPFDWLYIDFDTLQMYAEEHGFTCEKCIDGEH